MSHCILFKEQAPIRVRSSQHTSAEVYAGMRRGDFQVPQKKVFLTFIRLEKKEGEENNLERVSFLPVRPNARWLSPSPGANGYNDHSEDRGGRVVICKVSEEPGITSEQQFKKLFYINKLIHIPPIYFIYIYIILVKPLKTDSALFL